MRNSGVIILFFTLAVLILCSGIYLSAQETEPDTSSYIPYYYEGAQDYNLLIAAIEGYDSELDRLISKGANINVVNAEGATPLFFAVARDHLSTVRKILSYKPDLDLRTSYGETPLHIAVLNRNIEIAEALIRAGADIDVTDDNGAAPLHYASLYGNFYAADLLLYYRAELDLKTEDGTTPLMAAIWGGFAEIADLLVQNGANMEARDKYGFTPFLIASQTGDTVLMSFLFGKGVDIYAKNMYNYDALNLAISTNSLPAVRLLLEKGEKWTSPGNNGVNPYQVATAYGRNEIFNFLEENNVPGRSGLKFNEFLISPSLRFTPHDFYSGICLEFREPLIKGGIILGLDSKLWHTKVLVEDDERTYYQYMDKGSMAYAGIYKDFMLTDNTGRTNFGLSASLRGAYTFNNKFKGTNIVPANKFKIIPALTLKAIWKNLTFSLGTEYARSDFHRVGPVWFRTGCSYTFYYNNVKAPLKRINWN